MSEATKNLATALASFQGAVTSVTKGKTADTGTFSYRYADLADIAATAYPLLSSHGLAFACCPRATERGYELAGVLMHTSGESIEGSLPLYGSNPQQIGSSLTYARRYLLGALTGIVTDEDDDGASVGRGAQRADHPKQRQPRSQESVEPQSMTQRTRGRMFALFSEQGIPEDAQRAGISQIIGRRIDSRADLTEAEGRMVIASLESRPKSTPEPEPDGPLIPDPDDPPPAAPQGK